MGELLEGVILKGKSRVYRKKYAPKLLTVGWRGERRKLKKGKERTNGRKFLQQ